MALTREQINAAKDVVTKSVDVPEWGGPVLLRSLTGADRAAIGRLLHIDKDADVVTATLSRGLVGDDGQLLYTLDEVDELGRRNWTVIERLAGELNRMSSLGAAGLEQEKKDSAPTVS